MILSTFRPFMAPKPKVTVHFFFLSLLLYPFSEQSQNHLCSNAFYWTFLLSTWLSSSQSILCVNDYFSLCTIKGLHDKFKRSVIWVTWWHDTLGIWVFGILVIVKYNSSRMCDHSGKLSLEFFGWDCMAGHKWNIQDELDLWNLSLIQ